MFKNHKHEAGQGDTFFIVVLPSLIATLIIVFMISSIDENAKNERMDNYKRLQRYDQVIETVEVVLPLEDGGQVTDQFVTFDSGLTWYHFNMTSKGYEGLRKVVLSELDPEVASRLTDAFTMAMNTPTPAPTE